MKDYTIYFATNRNPEGPDPKGLHPRRYGKEFNINGREDLRFGKVTLTADENEVKRFVNENVGSMGKGDGQSLASYLAKCDPSPRIEVFDENVEKGVLGSKQFFNEMKTVMMNATDVLIFIHGYNVNWENAVGSALALREMLNRPSAGRQDQKIEVVLFSWPSDGSMMPFRAYFSDRGDARDSGYAVGRGFLKLRDYLHELRIQKERGMTQLCDQDMHVLCHSMGNFVLQHALNRLEEHAGQTNLPRLFQHIFLCSADVDDDVLEIGQPMGRLEEISFNVTIYYNREDKALFLSDTTKGNPDRLGTNGAARPYKLHNKIHQIDCTPVVHEVLGTEHSYFLLGSVNLDIKRSLAGMPQDSPERVDREPTHELPNVWRMKEV